MGVLGLIMVQTGAQLGPYKLLRRIGSGGMAEVFLAQRIGAEGFARTVAIKTIIALGAEEEGIGLFLDEARVAGYLEHAAIVQTVDLGYENDTLFIVMEYVPGPALSRIIRDTKKLGRFVSPHIVAYIGARVASALDYAHRRATTPDGKGLQLVHRDISPQNILLTRGGMVKLTDFGVARASVQTHTTRTGQVRGKAAYMAPEQVRAGALDGRTDVFALALVLYEALTGIRAYQRKTDIMSMRAILTDEVAPIHDHNPGVPDDLIAVIKKALAKKPDDRYANASEMADALQRTYRTHSESTIETEITNLINELFGPEQFSTSIETMPVEAWQPTITAPAEGGEISAPTPHKLSAGAKLSPKIAAMLNPQPQQQPAPPAEPAASSWTENAGFNPDRIQVSGVVRSPSAAFAGIIGPAGDSSPAQGMPATKTSIGGLADPVAFSELGYPSPPVMGSAGVIGTSIYTNPSAISPPPQRRGIMFGLIGFICVAAIAIVAIVVSNNDNTSEPAPIKGQPMAFTKATPAEPPNQPKTEPKPERDEPKPEPKLQPKHDAEPPPKKKIDPPPPGRPKPDREIKPHTDPKANVEDDTKRKLSPKQQFLVRAYAARSKAGSDKALKDALTKLINDHSLDMEKEISKEDRALVSLAEGK